MAHDERTPLEAAEALALANGDPTATDVGAETFRHVLRRFATGVAVVTTWDGARPWGTTANSFSSVSLRPPLVLVAFEHNRRIVPSLRATGRYAVSILPEDAQSLSDCFAGAPVQPDREEFCGAPWRFGKTGLPILEASIASLECTVMDVHPAGDHDLYIARVDAAVTERDDSMPLLYYGSRYLRIERATSAELEGKPER